MNFDINLFQTWDEMNGYCGKFPHDFLTYRKLTGIKPPQISFSGKFLLTKYFQDIVPDVGSLFSFKLYSLHAPRYLLIYSITQHSTFWSCFHFGESCAVQLACTWPDSSHGSIDIFPWHARSNQIKKLNNLPRIKHIQSIWPTWSYLNTSQ